MVATTPIMMVMTTVMPLMVTVTMSELQLVTEETQLQDQKRAMSLTGLCKSRLSLFL